MTAVPVPPAGDYETAIREAIDNDGSCERAGISSTFLAVYIRAAIAPVVAAEVAAERERIAQAIEAQSEGPCGAHWPVPSWDCGDCQRHAVFTRAGRLAREAS